LIDEPKNYFSVLRVLRIFAAEPKTEPKNSRFFSSVPKSTTRLVKKPLPLERKLVEGGELPENNFEN